MEELSVRGRTLAEAYELMISKLFIDGHTDLEQYRQEMLA